MVRSLLVLACLVTSPLCGISITFKCNDTSGVPYSVVKTWVELAHNGRAVAVVNRSETYPLASGVALRLELNPEDCIQIFSYTRTLPGHELYALVPLCRKFSTKELAGGLPDKFILVNRDNFKV